jgi:hypothetical protein
VPLTPRTPSLLDEREFALQLIYSNRVASQLNPPFIINNSSLKQNKAPIVTTLAFLGAKAPMLHVNLLCSRAHESNSGAVVVPAGEAHRG